MYFCDPSGVRNYLLACPDPNLDYDMWGGFHMVCVHCFCLCEHAGKEPCVCVGWLVLAHCLESVRVSYK